MHELQTVTQYLFVFSIHCYNLDSLAIIMQILYPNNAKLLLTIINVLIQITIYGGCYLL